MMRVMGLLAVVSALISNPVFAADSLPVNMSDLATADVIFTGTCTGITPQIKEGQNGSRMPVTALTFSVSDVIKGNGGIVSGSTFEFTMFGVTYENAKRLGVMQLANTPAYEVGKKYTLFLTPQSSLGLRSTIGIGQGKFSVSETADGKKQAVNEFNNKGLFMNMPPSRSTTKALEAAGIAPAGPPASGPLDYESFVRFVKEFKNPKKGD